MFCQLVYLRRCIPGRIRRALKELPKTLDETYARTLEEIDEQNWEYAHRLFQCVAAASRPLRVDELAEFLAFDFEAGSTPTLLPDWRPEDPAHAVLSMCSSLLAIVESEPQPNPEGDDDDDDSSTSSSSHISSNSPVIQFAHFSVKEYLTSARLAKANDTISHFHVSMTAAHTIVAQACLGVLLHLDEDITKDSLEDFPLAEYAAKHWVGHARMESVSSSVEDGMKRLFDPSRSHLSVWTWIYDPDPTYLPDGRSERPEEARGTPLHYAAVCGMHDVAVFLVIEHSQNVNGWGFNKETPLHVALRCGHASIAQLLLVHGADARAQDGTKRTPLLLASQGGHVEVARALLERGADTEARDTSGWSPLERASNGGHAELVRVLLEHGADVNAQDTGNLTPLHVVQGEEAARLLIKHGANANALNLKNQTPLHWTSKRGRVGVALVLLEHGVDVDARDAHNATPLHLATGAGYHDVLRLLLQNSANIHARDDKGQTPFMMATERRDHDIMQLLLEHGAEDHRERRTPPSTGPAAITTDSETFCEGNEGLS